MNVQRRTALGLVGLIALTASTLASEPISLFNGHDLTGWTKHGGAATYAAEDGAIVGRSAPNTFNTFLATDKEFRDFVLELDFKIDDRAFNSGIQIRSHTRLEKDEEHVFGYQVEIDPRADRKWTAGIYFEGGDDNRKAGWLNDLTNDEPAREAFRLGEWNHVRIEARGRRIQTWLNGVPAADFTDNDDKAFTPSGFIALQVHTVGDAAEAKEVRWKNIALTVLDDSSSAAETGEKGAQSNDAAGASAPTTIRVLGRVLGAMFGVGGSRSGSEESEEEEFSLLIGQPAPKFELESVAGDKLRLEDLRGQVVVLDFWATWCGPCVMALPELEKVHSDFAGKPVTVIGVNQRDEHDAIQEMVKQRGTTFTHVLDTDGAVGNAYGVSAIPQTVLIDREGVIQFIHQGYSDTLHKDLSENVQKLLNGEKLFDETKAAAARAKHDQEREAVAGKIGIEHPERLERLDNVLADPDVSLSSYYNPAQWVTLPGESQPALVVLPGQRRIVIVRPGAAKTETVDLKLDDKISIWDFCPVFVGQEVQWATMCADYGDNYKIRQFSLSLCGSDGQPRWTKTFPALDLDSYPDVDIVAGDLAGDDRDEIALLVNYDTLEQKGLAGPDGATRVLSVYDASGDQLLRSWVPGDGGPAVFVLPEPDGNKLLLPTAEGLTRFRVKASEP